MRFIIPLLVLSAYCSAASAALGGAPTDFGAKDSGRQVRSLAASKNGSSYNVTESTLSSGTVVKEYAAAGVVFAVSWKGPSMPDLQTLLGKHGETLNAQAARKPKAGNSQVSVNQADVVIHSGGHMRAYTGSAYLPSELPAGFTADDIQ
ncbi:DUF2844 domain-containing protein [Undibacterium terreum]|uniref:DUF2844 domain-containing protein n=1 Tax=Undibacterium terreum TaxID=1224302 RepID=A0A916U6I1_9BURK|nr:DUF2844 domain-containing protein [Undibacterium terreum]GGC60491.1 hypothetical protein GCM10011396_04230 [Undibacterium terreum]